MKEPSNYPPGVSGNEPQIVGPDECEECGCELNEDGECTYFACPIYLERRDREQEEES